MTDDDILPFDGGNTPDDAELAARIVAEYEATPPATAGMIERCVNRVRQRTIVPAASFASRIPRPWPSASVAVAAIALVMFTMKSSGRAPKSDVAGAPAGNTAPVDNGAAVQFELHLPNTAGKVSVVGDFNGWDSSATPMTQNHGQGAWSAKIALLPGRHVYAYIVDGEKWTVDPLAPQVPDAGYGAPANALVVEGGTR